MITEVMVRYGELSTKGKNKKKFIKQLDKNVKSALDQYNKLKIKSHRDRMHIELNGENADVIISKLKVLFGIQTISPVIKVEKSIEKAKEAALFLVQSNYNIGQTFKINTKRADHEWDFNTNEVNQILGEYIIESISEIKVKMKKPDISVRVEVRLDGIFLSIDSIKGAGGLPTGTSGKGMLMLSGGIDSPVAGYYAMKRGIQVEAVHFHSPPYTSPQALQKAKDLTEKLVKFSGPLPFIEVPFTEIQETIKNFVPQGYIMTITRRMMLRITDKIREQRSGLAIINGESLGQVASQTLESMFVINEVTHTPILRPLISMDKMDIIEVAQAIDTFELAILPYEDCCTIFTPPKPRTKPKLKHVLEIEEKMDIHGLIERAIQGINIEVISTDDNQESKQKQIFEDLL
ncbi:tRNA uracil 4-sulfurtransferase ThiI [Marinilactibacillus psychrotolerans]|uniref:tRNA uracil 4-sulfurtransferase ThiI n=1 Tax=Marinilactibacillus psychrotolerans TaxID=191770 RepID=UPI001C7CCE14|nr:tRNA uracil 4-sulfurtransferase ThiI [Marinilactibacillus psychrotolerans]GEQ33940.1 thiamine biosynthesis protein ThiI [Marinilactibacillus psychrotolerans]